MSTLHVEASSAPSVSSDRGQAAVRPWNGRSDVALPPSVEKRVLRAAVRIAERLPCSGMLVLGENLPLGETLNLDLHSEARVRWVSVTRRCTYC